MAFSDPIVGTEVLIRNQMQSEGFSVDPETGVTGWQIKKDGTATFNNLIIGGSNYNIDANGNATFEGITANSTFFYQGEELSDTLSVYPHGPQSATTLLNTSGTTGAGVSNGVIVGRIILTSADVNRFYRMFWQLRINVANNPTYIGAAVYAKWDSAASDTDSFVFRDQLAGRAASGTGDYRASSNTFDISSVSGSGTDLNFVVYLYASASGSYMQSDANNRLIIDDVGPAVAFGTYDASGGGTPVQQYTKTYSATDSASFDSSGGNRSGYDSGHCFQGYYSGTNGNQFSLVTFDYSTIASNLSGATINKVEVYLNNLHWYNNSGGTAIIGTHTYASVTGDVNYSNVDPNISSASFTYGQAKWVTVSNSIGTAFKNGTAKGIALGKGPSTSHTYYGYFAGDGQTGEPKLRITYTK